MFPWIRTIPLAFTGRVRPAAAVAPFSPVEPRRTTCARAAHAQALAHAAARRRRSGEDADYWRAVAPQALARARALRADAGFARLP